MAQSRIILDTNIMSYLMRGDQLAEDYAPRLQGHLLAISFVTVGELHFGAEKANWGKKKRAELERTLRNFVVVPYDHEIVHCHGRLVAERQRNGKPIAINDSWIAACAVRHRIPLITHTARHFNGITGLDVITETISKIRMEEH